MSALGSCCAQLLEARLSSSLAVGRGDRLAVDRRQLVAARAGAAAAEAPRPPQPPVPKPVTTIATRARNSKRDGGPGTEGLAEAGDHVGS